MNISLLVSNFHRARLFRVSLESIKPQLEDGDEIVCADDSLEYDGMLPVLKESGIKFQYKYLGNKKYRSGVFAKNVALKMAQNKLIIINDPEVYHITPNIKIIRERLAKEPRLFLVPGIMYFTNFPGQDLKDLGKMRVIKPSMAPFIGGVMKKELMDVGGWDERFKFWGNDDNDLMHRLGMNGVRHIADKEMKAIHLYHDRPPRDALGDANESLLYEENKSIIANEEKEWGKG